MFFAHAKTEHGIPYEGINVGSIFSTLFRGIVRQLLEHSLPAGKFYIQKTLWVILIAAVYAKKAFDAIVKLWLVMVQEKRKVFQILFPESRQNVIIDVLCLWQLRFQLEDALCHISCNATVGRIGKGLWLVPGHVP